MAKKKDDADAGTTDRPQTEQKDTPKLLHDAKRKGETTKKIARER